MSVPFSARLTAGESVVISIFSDGESVLLNLETEYYFGLNDSGTLMWRRLTSAPTIEAAYSSLLGDFTMISPDELRVDLAELVEQLLENRLVKLESDG
jgi:hypothetical protein